MKNKITIATIKSYTDIEQSKKLAKILPLESADMCYPLPCSDGDKPLLEQGGFGSTPCWSLSALLDVLESEIDGEEGEVYLLNIEKDGTWWNIWYEEQYGEENNIETESTEELIDACYELILKLYKLKML